MTRAQRAALAMLDAGPVWIRGHGRFKVSGGNVADRRVLDALVESGHAVRVIPPIGAGILPHYVRKV